MVRPSAESPRYASPSTTTWLGAVCERFVPLPLSRLQLSWGLHSRSVVTVAEVISQPEVRPDLQDHSRKLLAFSRSGAQALSIRPQRRSSTPWRRGMVTDTKSLAKSPVTVRLRTVRLRPNMSVGWPQPSSSPTGAVRSGSPLPRSRHCTCARDLMRFRSRWSRPPTVFAGERNLFRIATLLNPDWALWGGRVPSEILPVPPLRPTEGGPTSGSFAHRVLTSGELGTIPEVQRALGASRNRTRSVGAFFSTMLRWYVARSD